MELVQHRSMPHDIRSMKKCIGMSFALLQPHLFVPESLVGGRLGTAGVGMVTETLGT